ncbi:hypothetical protein BCR37DRAFT_395261 [Protomyces lactucae-debilis]|uniref:Uncharacterized protein n=1 Tax=Protomyces lactucae-debilis TaxID=2754530 RepID=A0A1Y2EXL6_PROLT|nr:uncharacterized protein BCR37DRAFT_395261 [Protomyces lactucae-debilis]ORY76318.1 hypothetical protein BCR37DRAFT_395261 [Protomyces lactucae-debilis]
MRTFDPERDHFVSFARILYLAGQTIVSGLLSCALERGIDFFLSLGVSGPEVVELWVPVPKARSLLPQLFRKVPSALAALLEEKLDKCFTLHDATRSSLMHNWALRTLPREDYSTRLLQAAMFSCSDVERIINKSDWIRTSVTTSMKSAEGVSQSSVDRDMILWSASAVENLQHGSVPDDQHWRGILKHLDGFLEGKACQQSSKEVALVETCERMLHHFSTSPTALLRRIPPTQQDPKIKVKHAATQTCQLLAPGTHSISTQCDILVERPEMDISPRISLMSTLFSIPLLLIIWVVAKWYT